MDSIGEDQSLQCKNMCHSSRLHSRMIESKFILDNDTTMCILLNN